MRSVQRRLERLTDREFERAKLLHETAVTDIANLKSARVGYANYTVLIVAALLGLGQLFADDKTITRDPQSVRVFFGALAALGVMSAIVAQVIQNDLRKSIRISRDRMFDANRLLAINTESTDTKMQADRILVRGLIFAPWLATLVLLVYLILKLP